MPTSIDIRELPDRLVEAIEKAAAGEEVVLVDGTTPRARLVRAETPRTRVAGLHPGAMIPAADFDAPLADDFWAGQQ